MNIRSKSRRLLAGGVAWLCGTLGVAVAAPISPWAPDSAVTPPLRFARSNDALCLSWKISPFSFTLASRDSLLESNINGGILTNQVFLNDEVQVMVPMTNTQGYFQLTKNGPVTGFAIMGLFEFAIFGGVNLEMGTPTTTTMYGPVHGNADIFLTPIFVLTFPHRVTAAGEIYQTNAPGDPRPPEGGSVIYQGGRASRTMPLAFHIGESNSPTALRKIIEVPPAGEDPNQPLGTQRLYNKADLIVTVADSGTTIKSGRVNSNATTVSLSPMPTNMRWLSTSQLYNRREAKTVKTVEIDIARLVRWSASLSNNLPYRAGTTSREVTILHVDDQRTSSTNSGYEPGVVVKNGATLPPFGLTVVTPDPLYVQGNYNVADSLGGVEYKGTANTTHTKPAALMGDAITVLSEAWNLTDTSYGSRVWADRNAVATTVNAAILAGVVETSNGHWSGGLVNFLRLLENWSAVNLTYNGSLALLFPSEAATGLWQGSGADIGIYNPPIRNMSFDFNFTDPTKLPPGTPTIGILAQPY